MLVEAWLPRAAAARPDHPAVNAITYADLLVRARRAAAGLRAAGVQPGDRVGLALPPSEDFATALHGCLLLGAVVVPLDLRQPSVSDVSHLVTALPDGEPDPAAPPETHDLDAPAIVVHTSGTTSAPKPVVLTYGNWLWSALGSAVALGHPPHERWLAALPLTHVGGLSILLRSAIAATTVVLHERWNTERVLAALRDDDVSIVSLVPTTLARLLDAGLTAPPALRTVLLGGAPISDALLHRAQEAGVPVARTYGLTEACSQVATEGVPLFCTQVEIASDGELLVSGPTIAPQLGGTLRTGDLGAFDPAGRLRITGRKADTIVTGGENVAPAEVEAVLEAHPAVREAAVHGRPDPEWGEAVVAIVVPRPGTPAPSPDDLRAHAARSLAPYKVPKAFTLRTDPLPRTGSGKLLRRELR